MTVESERCARLRRRRRGAMVRWSVRLAAAAVVAGCAAAQAKAQAPDVFDRAVVEGEDGLDFVLEKALSGGVRYPAGQCPPVARLEGAGAGVVADGEKVLVDAGAVALGSDSLEADDGTCRNEEAFAMDDFASPDGTLGKVLFRRRGDLTALRSPGIDMQPFRCPAADAAALLAAVNIVTLAYAEVPHSGVLTSPTLRQNQLYLHVACASGPPSSFAWCVCAYRCTSGSVEELVAAGVGKGEAEKADEKEAEAAAGGDTDGDESTADEEGEERTEPVEKEEEEDGAAADTVSASEGAEMGSAVKVGIAIGAICGVVALCGLLLFCRRRWRESGDAVFKDDADPSTWSEAHAPAAAPSTPGYAGVSGYAAGPVRGKPGYASGTAGGSSNAPVDDDPGDVGWSGGKSPHSVPAWSSEDGRYGVRRPESGQELPVVAAVGDTSAAASAVAASQVAFQSSAIRPPPVAHHRPSGPSRSLPSKSLSTISVAAPPRLLYDALEPVVGDQEAMRDGSKTTGKAISADGSLAVHLSIVLDVSELACSAHNNLGDVRGDFADAVGRLLDGMGGSVCCSLVFFCGEEAMVQDLGSSVTGDVQRVVKAIASSTPVVGESVARSSPKAVMRAVNMGIGLLRETPGGTNLARRALLVTGGGISLDEMRDTRAVANNGRGWSSGNCVIVAAVGPTVESDVASQLGSVVVKFDRAKELATPSAVNLFKSLFSADNPRTIRQ